MLVMKIQLFSSRTFIYPAMKKIVLLVLLVISQQYLIAQPRIIAECTITYVITAPDSVTNVSLLQTLKASTKMVYIKANESRTDLKSPAFCQTVIYNKSTGVATVLREFSNNKFMTTLDHSKWINENKHFEGAKVEIISSEHKMIAGYDCQKAILHLTDGSNLVLYYTNSVIPSVPEFEYQFKNVQGLVLAYEAPGTNGNGIVTYTATKVNTNPVPLSVFNIPTAGYRIL